MRDVRPCDFSGYGLESFGEECPNDVNVHSRNCESPNDINCTDLPARSIYNDPFVILVSIEFEVGVHRHLMFFFLFAEHS